MKEALHYRQSEKNQVICALCPKECRLKPGQRGVCRVRENIDGRLIATNYGECTSSGLDPIEKKPLYHFYPGKLIFSVGTRGCNLHCQFCQNWSIAHRDPEVALLTPEKLVDLAAQSPDSIGLAYTYSEPTVWYEFVLDAARIASEKGLKNVLVTNGFINEKPLLELLPHIDAMNIDVKGFSDQFYREVVAGQRGPVMRTVEQAIGHCHLEITTLLIPGRNDNPTETEELTKWLARLSPDLPLHFSRYFPRYQMSDEPTPLSTLRQAWEIARGHLHYVYIGNAPEVGGSDTNCPQCQQVVITRRGFEVAFPGLSGENCTQCGYLIKIIK